MAIGLDLSIGSGGDGGGSGGALATGILQLHRAEPLDTTLRNVADQADTLSPLQLSTTQVAVASSSTKFALLNSASAANGGRWQFETDATHFYFLSRNDADSSGSVPLYVTRTAGSTATTYMGFMDDKMNLSSNGLAIGLTTTTASARLHVRGDGTNPIAWFETSAGVAAIRISLDGRFLNFGSSVFAAISAADTNGSASISGNGLRFFSNYSSQANTHGFTFGTVNSNIAPISGTSTTVNISEGFAAAAGSANFRPLNIAYTINNSGVQSGVATGIYLRATETTLNSMAHNFIDLGTAAAGSLFSVTNVGAIKVATIADASAPNSSLYFSSHASRLVWKDAAGVVNNLY